MSQATELTRELAAKRAAEKAKFDELSLEQSGRGATTNYRDKNTGKKLSQEELDAKRQVGRRASRSSRPPACPVSRQRCVCESEACVESTTVAAAACHLRTRAASGAGWLATSVLLEPRC